MAKQFEVDKLSYNQSKLLRKALAQKAHELVNGLERNAARALRARQSEEKQQTAPTTRTPTVYATVKAAVVRKAAPAAKSKFNEQKRAVAQDGLPTATEWTRGPQRSVKLDSCARYIIAVASRKACGQPLKTAPPVDAIEGIVGLRLPVEGMWRFRLTKHYDQELDIDALMVPQVHDAFVIGVDFMVKKAANIYRNQRAFVDRRRRATYHAVYDVGSRVRTTNRPSHVCHFTALSLADLMQ